MRIVGLIFAVALLACVGVCTGHDGYTEPSESEVLDLLSETQNSWQSFRPLLARQKNLLVKSGAESPQKAVIVTYSLDIAVPMFKNQPLRFNSPEGFLLVEWLFDASRESAICARTASIQARKMFDSRQPELANDFDRLGESCSDSSVELYKVAQNASTLFLRHLKAKQ